MKTSIWLSGAVLGTAAVAALAISPRLDADADIDWGLQVQHELNSRSEQLFGIGEPLSRSALGPYTDADSTNAIKVAKGLNVSLVSSAVHFSTDQIVLWPTDKNPKYLFVCDESSSNPAVQRVDLSKPANSNATTILTGITACDPIRRTPWGTLTVAEEATDGGLYEIMSPLSITAPIAVTNRATGATTDGRVVKRQAVGTLAFEGNPVLPNGSMIFGDELRPGGGNPGGGIYKFVPAFPYGGGGVITNPALSPLASGTLYGLRIGSTGDNGQGTEIGQGFWIAIDGTSVPGLADANGNLILRKAQTALKLNGFYRPEDMDIDPLAAEDGYVRVCWTDTGNMSNGGGSAEETRAIYGEIMCLNDDVDAAAVTGRVPTVRRFVSGDADFNYFDNVAFQPKTGNLAVTEDGEVEVVKQDGTSEQRGNDILLCLPDGDDHDVQSDGCVRIASLRDTASEPTGIIFDGSGESLYVSLQHRATGVGALLRIDGFRVGDKNHGHHSGHGHDDDRDHDHDHH